MVVSSASASSLQRSCSESAQGPKRSWVCGGEFIRREHPTRGCVDPLEAASLPRHLSAKTRQFDAMGTASGSNEGALPQKPLVLELHEHTAKLDCGRWLSTGAP